MSGLEFALAAGTDVAQTFMGYQSSQQNAAIAKANSQQALADATNEADRRRRSGARQLATATVQMGSQGLDASYGSISSVLGDIAMEKEIEARQAMTEGERQSRYYMAQRDQFKSQATAALVKGVSSIATAAYDEWGQRPSSGGGSGNSGQSSSQYGPW